VCQVLVADWTDNRLLERAQFHDHLPVPVLPFVVALGCTTEQRPERCTQQQEEEFSSTGSYSPSGGLVSVSCSSRGNGPSACSLSQSGSGRYSLSGSVPGAP